MLVIDKVKHYTLMASLRKRSRWQLQLCCLTCFVILISATSNISAARAQAVTNETPLSVEDIVKLSHAGLSEELLVAKIKKNGKAFDLSADEIVELKKQGLSENVIRILVDPTQPYTPPAPLTPVIPGKKYPPDPLADLVPPDSGVYFFQGKTPLKIDLKVMLGMRKGKLLKGKPIAYLPGPAAKLLVKPGKSVFYLRLPDGKEISDIILLSVLEKDDRRELDGLPGPKGVLNSDDILQFDQVEVAARLFKLTPPPLSEGEYLFFIVGSSEPEKGTYGKGYDFGITHGSTLK